ncbi:MAG: T9SS type A sorting domain-containing protein [Melioribacteraceae bacterium]|nr:T9SS type A sorting domain-containing protein [Melioribacteraceae bacterium]
MYIKILAVKLILIATIFSQSNNHFSFTKEVNDNLIVNQMLKKIENTIRDGSYKYIKGNLLSIKKQTNAFTKQSQKRITSNYSIKKTPKTINFEIEKVHTDSEGTRIISCVANLVYDKNKSSSPFTLYFNKLNNAWSIPDDDDKMLSSISQAFVANTKIASVQTSSTEVEIIDNSETLIPIKYSSLPTVWEINKSLANSNFQNVDFFSKDSEVDINVYVYGPDPYMSESVYLFLDPVYGRLLFVNQEPSNNYEIKSYGDHNGEFKFQNPIAIAVGENGDLFVADIGLNKIIKLKYFPNTNTILYQQTLNIAGLGKPSDISYCKSYASIWPNRLVIVDMLNQTLLQVDLNGNILTTTTGFSDQNGYQPFNHIQRVATNRYNGYVALIDNGLKKVIQGLIINYTNHIYSYDVAESFSYLSNFSDIAICPNGEYLVSDIGLNKVHKFSFEGDYICSFSNSSSNFSGFNLPKRISSFANNFDGRVIMETNIVSVWSDNSGGRRFFQNSDVFNINHSIDENYFNFNYTLTSYSKVNLKILKNGVSQWSKSYSMIAGGYHEENIPRSGFDFGEYVFSIEYKPLYDEYYQEYEQGWKTKSIYFTNKLILPSIISSNTTISGDYTANTTTTINSGVTLTIESGTNITFENGSSLIVNGTLDVNGTSGNKVLFDFQYPQNPPKNGIKINSTGNANIAHAEIRNAYTGLFINQGNATIDNCTIRNGYSGIHLYNTNNSNNDTYITNTRIYEQTVGIDFYYSTNVHLSNNQIDHNYIAISTYSSSPYLAPDDNNSASNGYNWIHTNSFGLMADFNSNPWLGRVSCVTFGGNNTIDGNTTKDVNLNNNCTVYAENNWWGGGPPSYSVSSGSFFDPYPYLNSPPSGNSAISVSQEEEIFNKRFTPQITSSENSVEPLSLGSITNDKYGYNESWQIEWKLLYARNLLRVKKYNLAAKICESVITDFPDSARSYLALDLLWQSRKKDKSTQFSAFVKDKVKLKRKKQLYGVAELLVSVSEKSQRVSSIADIETRYKDTPLVEHVLFQKFMYYLYEENNLEVAKLTSDELGKLFPNSESYFASQRHLGNNVIIPLEPLLGKSIPNEEITEKPKTYELLGNYPNPFNPRTTISYALPYNSNVELTIYDITGKVVKVFDESVQSAGYQNIVWNGDNQQGSRVSSGVYLYRFKAISLENGKTYEKTAKMLLIK